MADEAREEAPRLHIYRAKLQPATRFVDDCDGIHRFTSIYHARRQLPAFCCGKRRWASHLLAAVYYDGTYFYCQKGTGCKRRCEAELRSWPGQRCSRMARERQRTCAWHRRR